MYHGHVKMIELWQRIDLILSSVESVPVLGVYFINQ